MERITVNLKAMAQYTFIKNFANKRAGESYPLLPAAAQVLISKGIVKPAVITEDKEQKKAGRPKKSK